MVFLSVFWACLLPGAARETASARSSPESPAAVNDSIFKIPETLGQIVETHPAKGPLIFYVQDLHCDYEVQSHIAKIIGKLAQERNLNFVAVEGASQALEPGLFSNIPDERVRCKTADYFLRQGRITGPEMYAAAGRRPIHLEGIETASLYLEDRDLARQFFNLESRGYVLDLRDSLARIKKRIYNPGLRVLDDKRAAFRNGSLPMKKYAAFLARLARRSRLDPQTYPHLASCVSKDCGSLPDEGKWEAVQAEAELLDRALRAGQFTSNDQRRLDRLDRRLEIIENLLNISATSEEVEEFRAHSADFAARHFFDLLSRFQEAEAADLVAEATTKLDYYVGLAVRFYQVADLRSDAFVENLQQRLAERKVRFALLVTGGFHADRVQAEMRKRGLSYVSITPRAGQRSAANPYRSILYNQRTPLEKFLARKRHALSPVSRLAAETDPLALSAEDRELFSASVAVVRTGLAVLLHTTGATRPSGANPPRDTLPGAMEAARPGVKAVALEVPGASGKELTLITLPSDAPRPEGAVVSLAGNGFSAHIGAFTPRQIQKALAAVVKRPAFNRIQVAWALGALAAVLIGGLAAGALAGALPFWSPGWAAAALTLSWFLAPAFTSIDIPGLRPAVLPHAGTHSGAKMTAGVKIANHRVFVRVVDAATGKEHYANTFAHPSLPVLRQWSEWRILRELGYVQNALDRQVQAVGLAGDGSDFPEWLRAQVWDRWSMVMYAAHTPSDRRHLPEREETQNIDLGDPLAVRRIYEATGERIAVDADGRVFSPLLGDLRTERRALGRPLFGLFNDIMLAAKHRGEKIVFINTTPQGGGVAIMRHAMLRLLRLYGIHADWLVMEAPGRENFQATKAMHNGYQGRSREEVSPGEIARLIEWNRGQLESRFAKRVDQATIIIVEDQQPAPMTQMIWERVKKANPAARIYWRNHIQYFKHLVDREGEPACANYRRYVAPFVKFAVAAVFHDKGTAPAGLEEELPLVQLEAAQPVTDGMNKRLSRPELRRQWHKANDLLSAAGQTPVDLRRPRLVQVSRFDPSKGLHILLDSFRRMDDELAPERARLREQHLRLRSRLPEPLRKPVDAWFARRLDRLTPQLIISGNQAIDDPDFWLMHQAVLLKQRGAEAEAYRSAVQGALAMLPENSPPEVRERKRVFYEETLHKFYDPDSAVRARFREELCARIQVLAAKHDDLFLNAVKRGFRLVERGWLGAIRQRLENDKVIYLQMSEAEGFEHNLTEALAKGSVGIASRDEAGCSGLPRQIEHGVTGFVTDPSPEASQQAGRYLAGLIVNDGLYFRMSRAALKTAPRNFTINSNLAKILTFDTLVVRIRHLILAEAARRRLRPLALDECLALQRSMLRCWIRQIERRQNGQFGVMPWLERNHKLINTLGTPEGWDWDAELAAWAPEAVSEGPVQRRPPLAPPRLEQPARLPVVMRRIAAAVAKGLKASRLSGTYGKSPAGREQDRVRLEAPEFAPGGYLATAGILWKIARPIAEHALASLRQAGAMPPGRHWKIMKKRGHSLRRIINLRTVRSSA